MKSYFDNPNQSDRKPIHLSPCEAFFYLQDEAILVDIRPEYEINYRVFDMPNVYLLPFPSYRERFNNLPKEKPVIIADSVGLKSPQVAQFLVDQGFSQVAYIIGGIIAWEHCDLPLTKDLEYQLNGGCACMLKPKK